MDASTATIFALVALIGANQVVVRLPWVRRDLRLFWALNFLDLVAALVVLVFGLPGYAHAPVVSWVVALLLVLHIAQNLYLKGQWEQEARDEARRQRDLERKQRRQEREERASDTRNQHVEGANDV